MRQGTLLFLRRRKEGQEQILLALKKRGHGEGKWNGVGGKILPGETSEAAACREAKEEIGVTVRNMEKVAEIVFFNPPVPGKDVDFTCAVYFADTWDSEPQESEEMLPAWYAIDQLPFEKMWVDDPFWLPRVIGGERIRGMVRIDANNKIIEKQFDAVPHF